jgi:hypothetical protein
MRGYIYKIANSDETIIYIGSTTQTIDKRFDCHKRSYKCWIEGKSRCAAMIYHHFRDHGIDNFSIKLISDHEIGNTEQLLQFEQLVIDSTNCVNKNAAWRSEEERQEQKRTYRESHSDKHRAYTSEAVQCPCGEIYTRGHKIRHEQTERHRYGIATDEQKKQIDQQRLKADQDRKEEKKTRRNTRVDCDCGSSYPKAGKSYHVRKSKSHLEWLANQ